MRDSYSTIYALLIGLILSACAATELRTGAERIIVTKTSAPKTCKFMGTVVGEQGGALAGKWTSNKHLAEGAMNDMKNKALDLGANYVVIETSTAGNTFDGDRYAMNGGETDVTHTGNAYKCDPTEIGL